MGYLRKTLVSAAGSSFNGGKSQVNLAYMSYPFINVIKACGDDIKQAGGTQFGAPADPSTRDANGYPMSIGTGGWMITTVHPPTADRPGNLIQTWDGNGVAQNMVTAVAYTITAATNAAQAVLTLNLAAPVSPNARTTNQLKTGQCISLNGLSGGTWSSVEGNRYQIIDAAVGGDATKVQISLSSTGLGAISAGQCRNSLNNKTTSGTACIGRYMWTQGASGAGGTEAFSLNPGMASMDASPNYVRNLAVYHDDDEAAYLAGDIWSPKYVAKLIEGKFGVLRTLDLQHNNTEKTVNWACRKPASYVAYGSTTWYPASCSPSGITTTNVGSAFSLAWPGYVLADKAIVHVWFNTTAAGAATLNVGGTGAKNILNGFCGPLEAGSNTVINGGVNDRYSTLVYIAALGAWSLAGGNGNAVGSSGMRTYLPPELMLSLCTAVGAHPYFVAPMFDDTANWVTGIATHMRDNAPPWMKLIMETTNETFNNAGGFHNNGYAVANQFAASGGWNVTTGLPTGGWSGTNPSATAYTPSLVTTGATTTITFTAPYLGRVGGFMLFSAGWGGVPVLDNKYAHVTAINVGGNPNRITLDVTSTGTWTSGGTVSPAPGEVFEWTGRQLAKIGKAISDVYSADTSRYEVLHGVQLAKGSTPTNPNDMDGAMNAKGFVLEGGWAGYLYTTAVTTSCYIKPGEYDTAAENTRVTTWAPRQGNCTITGTSMVVNSGTAPSIGDEVSGQAIASGTVVLSGTGPFTLNKTQNYTGDYFAGVPATRRTQEDAYTLTTQTTTGNQEFLMVAPTYWLNIANWANGWGIKKMYAYEGGPDPLQRNYTNYQNEPKEQFRRASCLSTTWTTLVQTIYASWTLGQYPPVANQYPSGFTAVFPSQFYFAGDKPRVQCWAMFADIYEATPPLFTGIKAYNQ